MPHRTPQRNSPDCPSSDVLSDLALGKLPEAELEAVGEHLKQCDWCQSLMESLDGLEDPLVRQLRGASESEPAVMSPELERQIAQAEKLAETIWGRAAVEKTQVMERPGEQIDVAATPHRFGQYELLEQIGSGGMGTVWKAHHVRLKRCVAIKFLPKDRARDPAAVARFEREMAAVGNLDHPHLVRAHDAGEIEGQPFLVMEYVEGLDFAAIGSRLGPWPIADACEAIRQAALGLQYAHEHGLVHRDIKPSNLMLTSQGQVRILDLGLALLNTPEPAREELTSANQAMGTTDYMAPEQITDSHSVDIRADLYSLGGTFYKLLTGQAPFSGPQYRTAAHKIVGHLHDQAPPIQTLRADVPGELAALVHQMLAKSPETRPAMPAEVVSALGPFARQASLRALYDAAKAAGGTVNLKAAKTGTEPAASSALADAAATRRTESLPAPAQPCRRRPFLRRPLVVGLFLGGVFAMLGILLYIKGSRIEVPDGSEVHVNRRGEVTVNLPSDESKRADSPETAQGKNALAKPAAPTKNEASQPGPEDRKKLLPNRPVVGVRQIAEWCQPGRLGRPIFGPESDRVACGGGWGGEIFIFDLTGKILRQRHLERMNNNCLAWSRDGRRLAFNELNALTVWDLKLDQSTTKEDYRKGAKSGCVAFSPDGKRLATGTDDAYLCVWDTETLELQFERDLSSSLEHSNWVQHVEFSPNGQYVAASGSLKHLTICNASTGDIVAQFGQAKSFRFSPDSAMLVYGDYLADKYITTGGTIHWMDVDARWMAHGTRREIRSVKAHNCVFDLAMSPDGMTIATCGMDGWVRLWDSGTGARIAETQVPGTPVWLDISPDGRLLAASVVEKDDQRSHMVVWKLEYGPETGATKSADKRK